MVNDLNSTRGINDYQNDKAKDAPKVDEFLRDFTKKGLTEAQIDRIIADRHASDPKFAEKLTQAWKERLRYIESKAGKFKNLIISKYSTLPLPQIIEKGKKYMHKYGFSSDEFQAFIYAAINDRTISGNNNMYNTPNTPMSKALGQPLDFNAGKMQVQSNQLDVLQEILKLHQQHAELHSNVVVQSLTYRDCAPEALAGTYDRKRSNGFSFVHPVVAALFLPRIKYLDEHMLLASISGIVASRYNNIPIKTQPDYELFWDIITDPNEVACTDDRNMPYSDLKSRVKLQVELWKAVKNLRLGRYYNSAEEGSEFMSAITNCKNGVFDSPDMTYVKDEGTILRKLFGAFSLRPTIVNISPLYAGTMTGNYNINTMTMAQITSIPIVNLRLPLNVKSKNSSVYLREALEQPDLFVENKMIVPKIRSIVYSRDVIVFYASRRYQTINFGRLNTPYNFTSLPSTTTGFETLNDTNVQLDQVMSVGDDQFLLRSVVLVERSLVKKDLIIGSSAVVVVPRDLTKGRTEPTYLLYDPQGALAKFQEVANGPYEENPPITEIPGMAPFNASDDDREAFDRMSSRRGTIYIYVKDQSQETRLRP
jgi:hypothetical protein